MRTLLYLFSIISFIGISSCGSTGEATSSIQTSKFTVDGVCGMCEKRIEQAALSAGVKLAEWDKESKTLKVIYKPSKVSLNEIHKAIAEAGHDTEKMKAASDAYDELPGCCAYRDGVDTH